MLRPILGLGSEPPNRPFVGGNEADLLRVLQGPRFHETRDRFHVREPVEGRGVQV